MEIDFQGIFIDVLDRAGDLFIGAQKSRPKSARPNRGKLTVEISLLDEGMKTFVEQRGRRGTHVVGTRRLLTRRVPGMVS